VSVAPDDIRELFSVFGPVEVRPMFGGAGIYAEGRMFALVSDGVIYLKADKHNAPAFEREQLAPFTYATRAGRRGVTSYRRMPDRLYDDPDDYDVGARLACGGSPRRGEKAAAEDRQETKVSRDVKLWGDGAGGGLPRRVRP
jgi:DNA transformation protein and related proteins